MQGWDLSLYKDPKAVPELYKNELLVSLSGNAFDAFVCAPLIAVSLLYLTPDDSELRTQTDEPSGTGTEMEETSEVEVEESQSESVTLQLCEMERL